MKLTLVARLVTVTAAIQELEASTSSRRLSQSDRESLQTQIEFDLGYCGDKNYHLLKDASIRVTQ